ncbi:MAG TPA: ScyD/ScyE family protein [Acidimicrobiales bacterium]
MRRTPLIPAALAAVALVGTTFAPAHASEPEPVVTGLPGGVLSLAVAEDGTVYASQNFAGVINQVAPGSGEATPIFADEGGREIGGLSLAGDVLTFTATSQGGPANAHVYSLTPAEGGGFDQTDLADTWAYEKANNPDGTTKYGIAGLGKKCVKQIPKEMRGFVVLHKGIKESHPYATTSDGDVTYVADAAANAILAIEGDGISTVAVLPPVKEKVTKQFRKGMGLPKCTQGKVFKGESVPTDVELGSDGNLYVTTLGGGLGEMMPVGALYKITPAGKVTQQTGGLMMPVGLAVSEGGDFWISTLGPEGGVLKNPDAFSVEEFVPVPFSGDVDIHGDDFYVTSTGLGDPEAGPFTGGVLKHPLVEATN